MKNECYRTCPICDRNSIEILKKIEMNIPIEYHLPSQYNVVRCNNCGMVFADTTASIEDYDWYYSNCNFYGDDSKDDNIQRYEIVKWFLELYCSKNSLMLDIGAGNGRFEIDLLENGYENIVGVDPSEESIARLQKAGIDSRIGNIYSDVLTEEENRYDCVFLFEVLEHLLLPGVGIRNIEKMLKNDGIFIISVPDYSQISNEKYPIANYFNLEHINYFSEDSLDSLMGAYGFQRINQKRDGIDLIHCYKKVNTVNGIKKDVKTKKAIECYLEGQQQRELLNIEIVNKLADNQQEIFVWGTGSYVMSLIAATRLLECNICGFIDNNKIKQGREMYGYKIYSPDVIKNNNCVILICSMLNGNDIRNEIRDMKFENECILL